MCRCTHSDEVAYVVQGISEMHRKYLQNPNDPDIESYREVVKGASRDLRNDVLTLVGRYLVQIIIFFIM